MSIPKNSESEFFASMHPEPYANGISPPVNQEQAEANGPKNSESELFSTTP